MGIIASFNNIVQHEGVGRLYRGIIPPILMEAPKRATKFAANDMWGQFYRKLFDVEKTNQSLSILTGASAGAMESFVIVPFELVKIRLQDKKSAHLYLGTMDCVKKIVKQERALALYNGYFGVIFRVKAHLPEKPEILNNFIAGAIGGCVGTMLNTPFDVVKSRIQNSSRTSSSSSKYNWSIPSLFIVAREEGFWALYKGFVPKVLRLGPGGGILLVVYNVLMEFFRK
ncbi:unnamed protein product [Adineta steineri]|uniref:Mitochondrial 2-oxodicarboxylate carrier n=1 Tax=Adineta steineri TaxID=433720 RepID=A0A813WUU5_9BILA|nr:unnamed protein product [Adineta steineri]